ncbi:carboxylesterase/lipase family protein [Nocardia vermiculata]|uniref:carboxylesterase/lipase family protein n=1 Tax=Nocardia vermiculata TaxID=257274 RepID=UPI000A02307E|nr:carboxylesterase family protein [Nocardia vermiculata]
MNSSFRRSLAALVTIVAASVTAIGCTSDDTDDLAVVHLDSGTIRGTTHDSVSTFQGLPYAAPPVGDRRWQAPQPVTSWTGTRDATTPGSACPQPQDQPISAPSHGEDCLFLNVTVPTHRSDNPRPVIVWIYGGSFNYGDGASYGATHLTGDGDAVVVTMNYRLGSFGFAAFPGTATANLGLLDQRAALEWVQRNASAFGGDPHNVTLMGQSGGGYSVCAHMAAPGSAGLFHRAIIQSAGCVGSSDASQSLEQARARTAAMGTAAGCTDAATAITCLRNKSYEEILAASESGHEAFRAIRGDDVLPVDPIEALETGRFHRVPVLHGITHDEQSGQVWAMEMATGRSLSADEYTAQIRTRFGDKADAVLAEYPVDAYETPSNALSAALTDSEAATSAQRTRRTLSAFVPFYAYDVDESRAPGFEGLPPAGFDMGTGHMADLAFLFENAMFEKLNDTQRRLSATMIAYWAQFAHQGDPNRNDLPPWSRSLPGQPYTQRLSSTENGVGAIDFADEHHIGFWRALDV